LLLVSVAFFAIGGLLSFARIWRNTRSMRVAGKALHLLGGGRGRGCADLAQLHPQQLDSDW